MAGKKRRALGRGLSALLGDARDDYAGLSDGAASAPVSAPAPGRAPEPAPESAPGGGHRLRTVPIEKIVPGPAQPRTVFDEDALRALADSVKANGVLTPLLVRARSGPDAGGGYELIAGERRWRAAQMARLHEVPVIIRDDLKLPNLFEVALVDNIQRENLNDIEEAAAYSRLVHEFGYTQKAAAAAVGRSRAHVANTLRLLKLPAPVLKMIETGALSAGHGRALLAIPDGRHELVEKAAREVIDNKMSVRELEDALNPDKPYRPSAGRRGAKGKRRSGGGAQAAAGAGGPDVRAIEKQMRDSLGLRVGVRLRKGGGGDVTITFSNLEQFDSLLETLGRGLARRRT